MNVLAENAVEVVRMHFQRLSQPERRELLRQLIADLDLPRRKDEGANGASARETEPAIRSGGFIEWLAENTSPVELESALSSYLPDFSASALTDSEQRSLINRRLAALGPVTLYELHQQLSNRGKSVARLTPDEIIEKTWGTIKGIDPVLLREIIEDEDYCGY